MSIDPKQIKSAFYTKMTGNTALMAAITGVYHINAPDGTAYPYITYMAVSGFSTLTFTEFIDAPRFQVDIWAKDTATAMASTILDGIVPLVTAALDSVDLTVTGCLSAWCERIDTPIETEEDTEEEAGIRRVALQYRVTTSKTRGRTV